MSRWTTIIRTVALCLLMLTGVELFACEFVPGSVCELAGSPLDWQEEGEDNCLCCCFHVVPVMPEPAATLAEHVWTPPDMATFLSFRSLPPIELPPRT
jgi:hypothetical protein